MSDYQQSNQQGYQNHDQKSYQNGPGKDNYFSNQSGGHNRSGGYSNRGSNGGGNWSRGGSRQNQEPFDEANVKLYKAYVGTGNREAPPLVLNKMKQLAKELEVFGFVLRVGGLDGPEDAFAAGATKPEIHPPFLPWKDYTKFDVKSYFNTDEVKCIAKMFHPTWDGLKPVIQAFLCKNVRSILGKDLKSPVRFVIGWSEDGAELPTERTAKTGSLGHVIALAAAMKIPVFNLGKPDAEQRLRYYLELPDNNQPAITEF